MPTYQYECSGCGHQFEIFQSMLDPRLRKCPECGKNRLQRLIGAGSGIIFKGKGFYETDYKRKASAVADTKRGESSKSKPVKEKSPSNGSINCPHKDSCGCCP